MLRQLYDSLSLRERFLLLGFIWLGLLFWFTFQMRGYRAASTAHSSIKSILETQQVLLDNEAYIEERVALAQGSIDNSRTYSGSSLFSTVDNLARQAEIAADINSPTSSEEGIFRIHSVRVNIRRATLEQLIRFVHAVRADAPYLSLGRFQLDANARDPQQLNAQFIVESFELAETDSR